MTSILVLNFCFIGKAHLVLLSVIWFNNSIAFTSRDTDEFVKEDYIKGFRETINKREFSIQNMLISLNKVHDNLRIIPLKALCINVNV